MIASSSDWNWQYSQTKIRRSRFRNLSRLDNRRFSTKSCRRRTRFSASSLARDSRLALNRSISRIKSVTIDALVPHLEPPITQDQVVTRHNAEIIINLAVAVISVKLQEVTSLADFANLDEPLYALIYVWLLFAGARWPSLDGAIKALLDRYAQRTMRSEPSLQRALGSPTGARANA
jgi:hypothetical protein